MPQPQRERLLFLDGLRGLAALYVVAYHALQQVVYSYPSGALSGMARFWTHWLMFGQSSVDIFIVLSGFCLMLPVARSEHGALRGGLIEFARRRAWRILPPYYAAVIISLALIRLVPALSSRENGLWSLSLPAFSPGVVVSHLFLAHNLSVAWLHKIDYPLWSVATEWQIYFVFALLLLPVWRRFGSAAAIATAFVAAYLPRVVFHHRFDGACFHFLVLFAFGMAAAVAAKRGSGQTPPRKWNWGAVSAVLWVVVLFPSNHWLWAHQETYDLVIGAATATLLLAATLRAGERAPQSGFLSVVVGILEARPIVALGAFSYSLYLIHAPLLALVFAGLLAAHLSPALCFFASEGLGIPVCLAAAYAFHLAFERPFMSSRRPRTEKQAELAAISSPAP